MLYRLLHAINLRSNIAAEDTVVVESDINYMLYKKNIIIGV